MRSQQLVRLALKQTRSDLRTFEWRALLLALFLATALSGFLTLLGNQLEKGLSHQSAAMLGADLSLSDSQPIAEALRKEAAQRGLQYTDVVQFSSMVSTDEQMLLSSIRAVDAPYPLRGEIITDPPQSTPIPAPGTAWAEQSLLERLGVQVGATVDLGYATFTITAAVLSSPDRGTGFRSFSPQLLINHQDLAATRVIQPGSRIGYRTLFSGAEAPVRDFYTQLNSDLTPQQRLWSVYADQPLAAGALQNASGFLRMTSLFGLLLCGLLITLSLRRYSHAQYRRSALLQCLGLRPQHVLRLYLFKLMLGWASAALLGILASGLALQLTGSLLQTILPSGLPAPDYRLLVIGPLLSLTLLILIGFAPLMGISRIPVMGLLRRDQLSHQGLSWPIRLIILALSGVVIALYLGSIINALAAILLTVATILVAGLCASLMLPPLGRLLARRFRLGRLLSYRLRQQRQWHRIQLGIMCLLLTLFSSLLLSQTELVNRWRAQLPVNTPNQFVINIQPWELQPLSQFLTEAGIDTTLYPMIRGRITLINDQPPEAVLSPQQMQNNALKRELNLSWSATAPAHNELLAGDWWAEDSQESLISIEQELATNLGLTLGDKIGFEVAGQAFSATISSIRKVEWRSFRPNFYMIFSPGVLQNYPQTYITSFRLGEEHAGLSRELLRQFPSLTLIDVSQWIEQASTLIDRLIQASTLILGLTLSAGLVLVQLLVYQELEQRRHENALLQVLGSTPAQTRQLDILEFALLGFASGMMAALLTEIVTGLISSRLLELPVILHPSIWILLPLAGTALFTLSTLISHRKSGFSQLQRH
ncbi:FtsX-like permease family protein [Amphritea opalescens]|uniref:FtsX-like permease family protein n=1 Tax=Amphritea opalescens TaxID=2490544 RepID=A0A430KLV6_9GAMM|nr:FtsX-like permease family protein [Amphritea opalescens]RTE64455.1 FtsX-like permease family protein [Amphritea opalescens]